MIPPYKRKEIAAAREEKRSGQKIWMRAEKKKLGKTKGLGMEGRVGDRDNRECWR